MTTLKAISPIIARSLKLAVTLPPLLLTACESKTISTEPVRIVCPPPVFPPASLADEWRDYDINTPRGQFVVKILRQQIELDQIK